MEGAPGSARPSDAFPLPQSPGGGGACAEGNPPVPKPPPRQQLGVLPRRRGLIPAAGIGLPWQQRHGCPHRGCGELRSGGG